MIVVDTSALVAIVRGEPEGSRCSSVLVNESVIGLSAVNLVEAGMVLEGRYGATVAGELDLLVAEMEIEVVPVEARQVAVARQAFRLYGKGRHPAGLNFGDCFSYALARVWVAPLLYVGSDFAQTDIVAA